MTATVLATMRDEAPFIVEWVAYHRLIGFKKIIVFSNDCTDGTDEILQALGKIGLVTHIAHTPDPTIKIAEQVARHVLDARLLGDQDWVIWLDADEFLNIHVGKGMVSDLEDFVCLQGAKGICISWRIFGDAGQDRFAGRFLAEPFTMAAASGEGWQNVKTFFRFDHNIAELFQHKPMLKPEFWANGGTFVSSKPVLMQRDNRLARQWIKGFKRGKIAADEAGWGAAQINHYAVRTKALFAFKQERGRIGEANEGGKQRYNRTYFNGLNLNTATDKSILKWAEPLNAEIAAIEDQLTQHCNLKEILQRKYSDILETSQS